MLLERAPTLKGLSAAMAFMLKSAADLEYDPKAEEKVVSAESKAHIKALQGKFAGLADFSRDSLHEVLNGYVQETGIKFKEVGPPLRVALVGSLSGPDLCQIMSVLGKEETGARLARFQIL